MAENCHIVETKAGEALIVLFLGRVQWMKICSNLEKAAHTAMSLKIMEPTEDVTAVFQEYEGVRGHWCTVPQDFDIDSLVVAGFSYVMAPEAKPAP
jgi:hypothetical protein